MAKSEVALPHCWGGHPMLVPDIGWGGPGLGLGGGPGLGALGLGALAGFDESPALDARNGLDAREGSIAGEGRAWKGLDARDDFVMMP
ncbi:MAG: hypothetical protein Q7T17_07955 [Microbacterium sp.]|uniref:hypothetical protein n=1 Tax=Microbacterium sp. TaxID=51671 RepID=UPI00272720CB|nr:hypothetical protein [Microbacterium sp.]MDO8382895.1 hypothetical protein [Microbacterium sp.]